MIISRKLKLNPTQEQKDILFETLQQYKQAIFSTLIIRILKNKISNGTELHKFSYFTLREQTDLPSQLVCSARCKATEILKIY